jgi:hypothetical protein
MPENLQQFRRASRFSAVYCRASKSDESLFWMEMLLDCKTVPASSLSKLMGEADQLVRIAVASINTARGGPREE